MMGSKEKGDGKLTPDLKTFTIIMQHYARNVRLIDNLLFRIHFVIVTIRWTGLAPWEFEFPFPGSLTSAFLA